MQPFPSSLQLRRPVPVLWCQFSPVPITGTRELAPERIGTGENRHQTTGTGESACGEYACGEDSFFVFCITRPYRNSVILWYGRRLEGEAILGRM